MTWHKSFWIERLKRVFLNGFFLSRKPCSGQPLGFDHPPGFQHAKCQQSYPQLSQWFNRFKTLGQQKDCSKSFIHGGRYPLWSEIKNFLKIRFFLTSWFITIFESAWFTSTLAKALICLCLASFPVIYPQSYPQTLRTKNKTLKIKGLAIKDKVNSIGGVALFGKAWASHQNQAWNSPKRCYKKLQKHHLCTFLVQTLVGYTIR